MNSRGLSVARRSETHGGQKFESNPEGVEPHRSAIWRFLFDPFRVGSPRRSLRRMARRTAPSGAIHVGPLQGLSRGRRHPRYSRLPKGESFDFSIGRARVLASLVRKTRTRSGSRGLSPPYFFTASGDKGVSGVSCLRPAFYCFRTVMVNSVLGTVEFRGYERMPLAWLRGARVSRASGSKG